MHSNGEIGRAAQEVWRAQQETLEKRESRESHEALRRFGDAYRAVIDVVNGERAVWPDAAELGQDDRDFVERMVRVAEEKRGRQAAIMGYKQLTPEQLLKPILRLKKMSLTPEEIAACNLEEVTTGTYRLQIPAKIYGKIMPGVRATAVTPRGEDAIAFVMQPIYDRADHQAREDSENIPHETHHVLWRWMQRDGMTENAETNTFSRRAFEMYRDEMMARAVSGGGLFGYSHMHQLSPEQRSAQHEEHGEVADRVQETVASLNDVFHELQVGLLQRQTEWQHVDLVKLIWQSTSFEQLRQRAEVVKEEVLAAPEKPKPQSDAPAGWGFL